jgi:hypothetical protein
MANTYVMDGKEYVEVERKANVGDKVVVIKSGGWYHTGQTFEVISGKKYGFRETPSEYGSVYVESGENIYNERCSFISLERYRVLEPLESEDSPLITDLLANLARRVEYLERKATSLEQQLRDTQGNVEKLAEELATVKHQSAPKEVEVVTFEKFLDSIADKVAERLVGGGAR